MKVARLSAQRTDRRYLTGDIYGTYFCHSLCRPLDQNAVGKIKSMKNPSDLIGNGTFGFQAYNAVRYCYYYYYYFIIIIIIIIIIVVRVAQSV